MKEELADAPIEPHALGHFLHIRPDAFTECCDLVDEGDLGGKERISERHRHRYEVNMNYRELLEEKGLRFSGVSPDGRLPEIVEYPDHPWFIGVQFHPELKSRPFDPHPLFRSFVEAAVTQSRLV